MNWQHALRSGDGCQFDSYWERRSKHSSAAAAFTSTVTHGESREKACQPWAPVAQSDHPLTRQRRRHILYLQTWTPVHGGLFPNGFSQGIQVSGKVRTAATVKSWIPALTVHQGTFYESTDLSKKGRISGSLNSFFLSNLNEPPLKLQSRTDKNTRSHSLSVIIFTKRLKGQKTLKVPLWGGARA